MTKKSCLIFSNYSMCPTDGGPSGFLAQNLLSASSPYFHLGRAHQAPFQNRWQRWSRRTSGERGLTLQKIGLKKSSRYLDWLLAGRRAFACEDAVNYPWIWFHDVMSMAACLDLIPSTQKIILQPHTPELQSEEEMALENRSPEDIEWVKSAERRAFDRADLIVLPNEQTRAIYAPILRENQRIEYLDSGCRAMAPRLSLPLDPRYVYFLYLGRRMAIKGFDLVVKAFERAHTQNPKLRLLIVGEGPAVSMAGALDIGYSKDPAIWLEACDYFVSANRQSYFDLSVMEALSVGTPLILACTGGHGEFRKINSSGIVILPEPSVEALTHAFLSNLRKRENNLSASEANKTLHRERFSDERYRLRLDAFLSRIIGEKDRI